MTDRRGLSVSRRAAMRTVSLASLTASVGMAATAATASGQSTSVSGIVGAWRVRVPVGPNRNAIQYLGAFLQGGIFLGLDSPVEPPANPGAAQDPVDYSGPFVGQWLQLPDGSVRVTAVELNYNRRGAVTSEETTNWTVTYDAATDTLSGSSAWREVANDGTLLNSFTGPVQLTRIRVEV